MYSIGDFDSRYGLEYLVVAGGGGGGAGSPPSDAGGSGGGAGGLRTKSFRTPFKWWCISCSRIFSWFIHSNNWCWWISRISGDNLGAGDGDKLSFI